MPIDINQNSDNLSSERLFELTTGLKGFGNTIIGIYILFENSLLYNLKVNKYKCKNMIL